MNATQKYYFNMFLVWIISIILMAIFFNTASTRQEADYTLGFVPSVAAFIWTVLAWLGHRKNQAMPTMQHIQHAPTSYKMALLLEMMTEDEREALKHDLRRQILAEESSAQEHFDRLMLDDTEKRKRG